MHALLGLGGSLSMPMRLTMHPLMLHIDKSSGEYEQQPAPTKTLCSDNV